MKKIKTIFIPLLIIMCCGCDIKYNINFSSKNNVVEKINISNFQTFQDNEMGLTPIGIFFQKYVYNLAKNSPTNYIASQNWKNFDNFKNYSILFDLFDDDSIEIDSTKFNIDISINDKIREYIKLYNSTIENLEFSIYIPYYVSKHNADKVNNNTYTWNITDLENDSIKINFDMSKSSNYVNKTIYVYIIIGLSVIIVGVVIYFVMKNKKANEI